MKLLAIVLASLLVATLVQAASFDCAKASTKIEHIICNTPEISKLDSDLAASYKSALQDTTKTDQIRQSQKRWMKGRNKCQDENCLRKIYQTRISELDVTHGNMPIQPAVVPAQVAKPAGEYVLRAVGTSNYKGFCSAFTANLNEFRNLDFNTCNPRLSPKFPQFGRPQWEEIPLDMDMVKRILTGRPSIGFKRWLEVYESARAAGEVKLWRTKVDLLNDGNLDTLIKLDHASDGTQPYCSYADSKQMIIDIPNPESSRLYSYAHFDNADLLGGDMIYDSSTKSIFELKWDRYGAASGHGTNLADIGGTANVMVSAAFPEGFGPVCWIDWVQTGHRNSRKNELIDSNGFKVN